MEKHSLYILLKCVVGVFFFIIIYWNDTEKIIMAHAWSKFFLLPVWSREFVLQWLLPLPSSFFSVWFLVFGLVQLLGATSWRTPCRSKVCVVVWNSNTLASDVFIGSGKYIFCVFLRTLFDIFQWGGFDFGFCWVIGFNCRRCFLRVTPPPPGRFRLKVAGKYN